MFSSIFIREMLVSVCVCARAHVLSFLHFVSTFCIRLYLLEVNDHHTGIPISESLLGAELSGELPDPNWTVT